MLPNVTLVGRAVDDPELRFTQSGDAVANLRVVASERRKNRNTDEWEDGDRIFLGLSVWKHDAEAVAEDVRKGDKVLVSGKLFQREYETRDGNKGKSIELKGATVALIPGGRPQAQRDNGGGWSNNDRPAPSNDDPWAAPPQQQQDSSWSTSGQDSEPPF